MARMRELEFSKFKFVTKKGLGKIQPFSFLASPTFVGHFGWKGFPPEKCFKPREENPSAAPLGSASATPLIGSPMLSKGSYINLLVTISHPLNELHYLQPNIFFSSGWFTFFHPSLGWCINIHFGESVPNKISPPHLYGWKYHVCIYLALVEPHPGRRKFVLKLIVFLWRIICRRRRDLLGHVITTTS